MKEKNGITTSDNDYFLRMWQEVSFEQIRFDKTLGTLEDCDKWIPYNKAGGKRRWYGNLDFVINWLNKGQEIKEFRDEKGKKLASVRNESYYFKEQVSWSDIKSNGTSFRYYPAGMIFDASANSAYSEKTLDMYPILAIANSKIMDMFAEFYNPGIHFKIGNFYNVPYPLSSEKKEKTGLKAAENVLISKQDWDAHETSWDFEQNPLVALAQQSSETGIDIAGKSIHMSDMLSRFKDEWTAKFMQLHANEEELNKQFIDIYGLQDELTPDVPLDEITILQQGEKSIEGNKMVWHDDVIVKQLVSYAIGCIMGRYSIDHKGLILANQGDGIEEYHQLVPESRFEPDDDGIVPLMGENSPFSDNAVSRISEMVKVVFGSDSQTENLNYIEATLGKSLSDYLQKDFWKDHKKMYQKRPIYWLFASTKGAFQCMVYMHRMDAYVVGKVRIKYLLPYIEWLKAKIEELMVRQAELSSLERRQLCDYNKWLDECREYDVRLHEVANQQISIDLDDGVVVNYAKYGDVLAKLK